MESKLSACLVALLLGLCSLAQAQDGLRQSVTTRVGATGALDFYYLDYGVGESYSVGWSMLRERSLRWDFQLGIGLQHSVVRYGKSARSRGRKFAERRGVVGLPVDLLGRRWMETRGKGWFMLLGAQAIVQLWGYSEMRDGDGAAPEWQSYPPAWTPTQFKRGGGERDALYPVVPSFLIGAGYRLPSLPVEVGVELVQEVTMRHYPYLYSPVTHLLGRSYLGVSASWCF